VVKFEQGRRRMEDRPAVWAGPSVNRDLLEMLLHRILQHTYLSAQNREASAALAISGASALQTQGPAPFSSSNLSWTINLPIHAWMGDFIIIIIGPQANPSNKRKYSTLQTHKTNRKNKSDLIFPSNNRHQANSKSKQQQKI
jgi:hypothetical protein